MPPELKWTKGVLQAWEYIVHSIAEGFRPTESYTAYELGGGVIRKADWFAAWREAETLAPNAEFVLRMPGEWTLPSGRFTDVEWDMQQNYMVQTQIGYFDREQKKWVTEWRAVEFDAPPTKEELESAIVENLFTDYPERTLEGWVLTDVNMYHKKPKAVK